MAVRGRGWPRWIGGAIGGVMGDGDAFWMSAEGGRLHVME